MTAVLQPCLFCIVTLIITTFGFRLKKSLTITSLFANNSSPADFNFRKDKVKRLTVNKFFAQKPKLCDASVNISQDFAGRDPPPHPLTYDFGQYSDFLKDINGGNPVKSFELWSAGVYTTEGHEASARKQQEADKLPEEPFNHAGFHVHNWYMIEMSNSGHVFTVDDQFFTESGNKHALFSPYLGGKDGGPTPLIDMRLSQELGKEPAKLTNEDWEQLEARPVGQELAQLGNRGAEMYFGHTRIGIVYGVRAFRNREDAKAGMARYYSGGVEGQSKALQARSFVFRKKNPTFCGVVERMREVTKSFDSRGGTDFEDQGAASATQVQLLWDRHNKRERKFFGVAKHMTRHQDFQAQLWAPFHDFMGHLDPPPDGSHGKSVSCRTLYWQTIRLAKKAWGSKGSPRLGNGLLEQFYIVLGVAMWMVHQAHQKFAEGHVEEAKKGVWKALGYLVKAGQDLDKPPQEMIDKMTEAARIVEADLHQWYRDE